LFCAPRRNSLQGKINWKGKKGGSGPRGAMKPGELFRIFLFYKTIQVVGGIFSGGGVGGDRGFWAEKKAL